jgi:hypothetical protein
MIRNEKGSTLIITLLTITVIVMFSTVLISTTINSSLQINKTEQDIQATNLAEMGVVYFNEAFSNVITSMESLEVPFTLENVEDQVMTLIVTGQVMVTPNYQYTIQIDDPYYDEEKKVFIIPYSSIGTIQQPSQKDVERKLTDYKTVGGAIIPPGGEQEPDNPPYEPSIDQPFRYIEDFDQLSNLQVTDEEADHYYDKFELKSGSTITNPGFLLIKGESLLQPFSTVKVGGNANLTNKLEMKDASSFTTGNNLYIKGATLLDTTSTLHAGGSLRLDNMLDLMSQSQLTVEGYLFVKGATELHSPSQVTVGKSASIDAKLFLESGSSLTTGGHLYVFGDVELDKGATVNVAGNATFERPVDIENGRICINGTATFNKHQSKARIHENVNSCSNQPNGTIYVLNKEITDIEPGTGGNQDEGRSSRKIEIGSGGVQY